jgi:heme/copper-type cytochrome/quinol oxidase subunit 3
VTILIILSAIITFAALIATIMIAVKPNDKNYIKTTKKRMIRLSLIYVIVLIPALILTVLYYVYG